MKIFKLMLAALLLLGCNEQNEVKQVTVYPTYGFVAADQWKIPVRVWVHTPRETVESILTRLASGRFDLNDNEKAIFRHRLSDLVADSRSGQDLVFAFDQDADQQSLRIVNSSGEAQQTDRNGVIANTFFEYSKQHREWGQSIVRWRDNQLKADWAATLQAWKNGSLNAATSEYQRWLDFLNEDDLALSPDIAAIIKTSRDHARKLF